MSGELLVTRGVPGSGKTRWALAWVDEEPSARACVGRDALRILLYGRGYYPLSDQPDVAHQMESVVTIAEREVVRGNRVVRMWRSIGLTACQVAPGDF